MISRFFVEYKNLSCFNYSMKKELFHQFHVGLERESLRINERGEIVRSAHPTALGSSLTHPYIRTDFSEQQIEWNTPPLSTFSGSRNFLKTLIQYTLQKNPHELFWPFSMPPPLEEIEIARYGSSLQGKQKTLYREGLKRRYGAHLQMISGIHYNFSFDLIFWKALHEEEKSKLSLKEFMNQRMFDLIRNVLREGWLLTYLFGASPFMDPSYSDEIAPFATSIRTSSLGYYSRVQNQLAISFNSLEDYLEEMERPISTPEPSYLFLPARDPSSKMFCLLLLRFSLFSQMSPVL